MRWVWRQEIEGLKKKIPIGRFVTGTISKEEEYNSQNMHLKYFSWAKISNPHRMQMSWHENELLEQWKEETHVDVRVKKLCPGVTGQHVDDDHLAPLLHVNQQVTQLPVVLVDQVNALRTNLLKSHDDAAGHQLGHIFIETRGFVRRTLPVNALII